MRNYFFIFVVLTVCSVSSMYTASDHLVLDLTLENIQQRVIASSEIWVIELYANWCGHCKAFAPEVKKAAENLKGIVNMAAIDCDLQKELCGALGVEGFPTVLGFGPELLPFPGGEPGQFHKPPQTFQGARTAEGLIRFSLGFLTDKFVQRVDMDNVDKFLAGPMNKVLLFSEKERVSNLYRSLSLTFKNGLDFGQARSTDTELVEKYGIDSFPAIIVIQGEEIHKYEGETKKEELGSFFIPFVKDQRSQQPPQTPQQEREQIVPELHHLDNEEDFNKYCKTTGLCLVAFLDSTSESHESYLEQLNTVMEEYPTVRFMWLEGPNFPEFGKGFYLAEGYPQAIILHKKKLKYKAFFGGFEAEQLSEFVDMILKGRGRIASLKSLPAFE